MRTFQGAGMNGGLTLELTSDGGFVGTGQHESSGAGSCDLYVYKVDECGSPQWFYTYGGPGEDGGKSIRQTKDGGYILAGLAKLGAGDYDNWLVKLSPSGAIQWTKTIGGTAPDYGLYAIETNDGGYIMSGFISGFGWGGLDASITKTDSAGNVQWTKIYGGAADDWGDCIIQAPDSGYYISGYTRSFGAGAGELWLFKLDKNGTLLWSKAYGGIGEDGDQSWGIEAVLNTDSTLVFAGNTTNYGAGGHDILMIKTDLDGNLIWAKTYGGPSDDQPRTIIKTNSGGFAIAGWTLSFGFGDKDAYLLVTDSAGNLLWSKTYGSPAFDKGMGLRQAPDSGFAISVVTTGFGANYYDPLFLKTDATGNVNCNVTSPTSLVNTVFPTITIGGSESSINPSIGTPVFSVGSFSPNDNYLCFSCNIIPQITVFDTAMCEGDTIFFYNSTQNGKKCVQWFVEGASYGYGDSIGTAFYSPGIYHVNLVAGCGNSSDTAKVIITIYPRSNPNFSVNDDCLNKTLIFTDSSQGNVIAWQYDFGDGSVFSGTQNSNHNYSLPGTYNVQLKTMTNFGCIDSVSKPIEIFPLPSPSFFPTDICLYDSAIFQDSSNISAGTITGWSWDFGDGSSSSSQNPAHKYSFSGTFSVQLVPTSDKFCNDTLVKNIQIYYLPDAGISAANTCIYNKAEFYDQSTITNDSITAWYWNFGDGLGNSTDTNPSYQFANEGLYTVKLSVTSNFGCSDSDSIIITIYPKPAASFSDSNVCLYSTASFSDSSIVSTGAIAGWEWDFGDSLTSNAQNPGHNFSTEGTYLVSLIASTNSGCSDTSFNSITIFPVPISGFSFSNVCEYDSAVFGNSSSINSGTINYFWRFGDGDSSNSQNPSHLYSSEGNFIVTLIVSSDSGCFDTLSKTIIIQPSPKSDFFSINNCLYDTSFFNDSSTIITGNIVNHLWDFDDGSNSSQVNPYHKYSLEGFYNVVLITYSDSGCSDTTIKIVEKFPIPLADFSPEIVCLHDSTQFTDFTSISSGNIVNWVWNFGDGTALVNQQNPFHFFPLGSYNVTLIAISSNGCLDDSTKQVGVYPLPQVNFNFNNSCINQQPTMFQDSSYILSGVVSSWLWKFGDDSTSTLQNPGHIYSNDSTYNVKLISTSNNNCKDSITKQLIVFPLPQFSFASSPGSGCVPLCVTFVGFSINPGVGINDWVWNFDDGTGPSQQPSPHCFTMDGIYKVALTAISDSGCMDTVSVDSIVVFPKPIPGFSSAPQPTSIFNPEINFSDSSFGAVKWNWDFGDLFSDSIPFPVHLYKDTGKFTVRQIVTNADGCKDTIEGTVYISPEFVVYIPNAFTPNHDGKNEFFFLSGSGIDNNNFGMYIYDRWGNLAFETHDLSGKWNGKTGNMEAKEDTYVYLFLLKDYLGYSHKYTGRVTLLR